MLAWRKAVGVRFVQRGVAYDLSFLIAVYKRLCPRLGVEKLPARKPVKREFDGAN